MTPNRSLALTAELRSLMRTDLLQNIAPDFPFALIERHQNLPGAKPSRDRVYNTENTLLTMVLSALNPDKSLKQSVNVFKSVFEQQGRQLLSREAARLMEEKEADASAGGGVKKLGRPR